MKYEGAMRLQSSLYSRFDSELVDGAGDGEPGNGEPGDSVGDGEPGNGESGDGAGDGEPGDGELGDGELGDGAVDRRRAVDRDEKVIDVHCVRNWQKEMMIGRYFPPCFVV